MSSAPSINSSKKRRVVLQPTAPAPQQHGDLDVSPALALSDEVSVRLRCKRAPTETIHNAQQLKQLLVREADLALRTHEHWARTPQATWIKRLLSELPDEARPSLIERQRKLSTVAADDFGVRWELMSSFASHVIDLWFSSRPKNRVLEDVLHRCSEFGHSEELARGGVALSGRLVREMASGTNLTLEELFPMVEALGPSSSSSSSTSIGVAGVAAAAPPVFRVERSNAFLTDESPCRDGSLTALREEVEQRLLSGVGGLGSLNTTFEYGVGADGAAEEDEDEREVGGDVNLGTTALSPPAGTSGVQLLDSYMSKLDEAVFEMGGGAPVRLNPRLYLIWKLQGYCTPYHQDVHVPPHFTLYNQTSGACELFAFPSHPCFLFKLALTPITCVYPRSSFCSAATFHFLPLLVGLFAAHVGRQDGPQALAALLAELDRRGIGERTTLGPAQMLLILPFGAHAVFVPRQPQQSNDLRSTSSDSSQNPDTLSNGAPASAAPAQSAGLPAALPPAHLAPFELSVIRAAELYVRRVCNVHEAKLMKGVGSAASGTMAAEDAWREVLPLTPEEKVSEDRTLRQFAERQEALCAELGMSRQDWLWAATRLQQAWDAQDS